MRRVGITLSFALLLVATVATVTSADPPRPGTTNSSLTESEEATLWSRQPADEYVSSEVYRDAYGENRTTIHDIANGTDLTFSEPPSTASRWTQYAHGQFEPGDASTSRYPPSAEPKNGSYIREAHASIFAISPSTHAHVAPGDERFYVPTEGTVLGVVDYRLAVPFVSEGEDTSDEVRLESHGVVATRLYADGELIANGSGSQRPALEYTVENASNVTLEADVRVTLAPEPNGTENPGDDLITETVTVSDQIAVDVYDLSAAVYDIEFPDGRKGTSIYQTEPWQGYTLDDSGRTRVRGVWRFFTARDTDWDTLVESSSTDTEQTDSNALPVYVHAYPSKLGPRAKPEYSGPEIVRTWGNATDTPRETLPENVTVDVVRGSYEPTWGMSIRSQDYDQDALTVHGIVYGTDAELLGPIDDDRALRESDLSTEIVDRNDSGITVLLTLEDAGNGGPIVLDGADRSPLIGDEVETGHIEIDGERVETNESGEAIVHLSEQGLYTARYEPAPWLDSYPVYAGDSAVVRWHSLRTMDGWVNLVTRSLTVLVPFLVMLYAGHRLGTMLRWRQQP